MTCPSSLVTFLSFCSSFSFSFALPNYYNFAADGIAAAIVVVRIQRAARVLSAEETVTSGGFCSTATWVTLPFSCEWCEQERGGGERERPERARGRVGKGRRENNKIGEKDEEPGPRIEGRSEGKWKVESMPVVVFFLSLFVSFVFLKNHPTPLTLRLQNKTQ